MNKKIIAIIMASSTLFSLAACNSIGLTPTTQSTSVITTVTQTSETSAPETTETEETTEETTESEETTTEETSETKVTETKATEETTSETTAKPTPKSIGKTTVSNAYKRTFTVNKTKYTTKYPKITIKGVSTTSINKEIANKFGPIAKKNASVVKYSYYIGKKYASIFVTVNLDAGKDGNNYYVYNVSRVTGKKLSKSEMLKLLGMKDSAFKSKVTTGVKKWWNDNILKNDKTAATKKLYNKAIASKSINSAVIYVNSKGKKCFLIRQMKAPTQMGNNDIYMTI